MIHHPNADTPVVRQAAQHGLISSPRRAEFQQERTNLDVFQERQEGRIVAGQGHAFIRCPVAATDVQCQPFLRQVGDRLINERFGKGQFLRGLTLLSQRATHKRAVV